MGGRPVHPREAKLDNVNISNEDDFQIVENFKSQTVSSLNNLLTLKMCCVFGICFFTLFYLIVGWSWCMRICMPIADRN